MVPLTGAKLSGYSGENPLLTRDGVLRHWRHTSESLACLPSRTNVYKIEVLMPSGDWKADWIKDCDCDAEQAWICKALKNRIIRSYRTAFSESRVNQATLRGRKSCIESAQDLTFTKPLMNNGKRFGLLWLVFSLRYRIACSHSSSCSLIPFVSSKKKSSPLSFTSLPEC